MAVQVQMMAVLAAVSLTALTVGLAASGAGRGGSDTDQKMRRRPRANVMRVQVQKRFDHYADATAANVDPPGVLVIQYEAALETLFYEARALIPDKLESAFLGAVARSSIWAHERQRAGGVIETGNVHRELFPDPNDADGYRLDTENVVGHNLRR